ncbi:MAG TPA: response regulator transcription factor [bacterium]|nr:response regulator transcription factor [bacterium]
MTIRVLLADDHQIIREGLRSLLTDQKDIEVVAEADTGRSALNYVEKMRPDVILMDIAMPDINGIEATRQIKAANPEIRILALSMHSDQRFVGDMLRAGATGYLLKDCAGAELVQAIRTVYAGKVYLSPSIAGIVTEGFINPASAVGVDARQVLTVRELEVVQLLAEGLSTKEVAFKLNVSIKTVETHRKNIFDKLSLSSIAELTKYAIREGLTSLEF